MWWLLFRLMFLSGITKIASGDPTWADWTALTYHYATQPLPLWTGWYVHQLPAWIHRLSAGGMFVVELLLPWAIFLPARWHRIRLGACAGLVTPHQPRLDWQLWFAALDPRGAGYWLSPLMTRLFEGGPAVTALVGDGGFPDGPPRYLRLAYYNYRFTTRAERADIGAWWHRELIDYLTEPVSLADVR